MARTSSLRASDADREAVAERLREAAAEGRLEPDELEDRLHRALRARTYGDLGRLVADLPAPSRRGRRGGRRDPRPRWELGPGVGFGPRSRVAALDRATASVGRSAAPVALTGFAIALRVAVALVAVTVLVATVTAVVAVFAAVLALAAAWWFVWVLAWITWRGRRGPGWARPRRIHPRTRPL
jgi:hypothetical protein